MRQTQRKRYQKRERWNWCKKKRKAKTEERRTATKSTNTYSFMPDTYFTHSIQFIIVIFVYYWSHHDQLALYTFYLPSIHWLLVSFLDAQLPFPIKHFNMTSFTHVWKFFAVFFFQHQICSASTFAFSLSQQWWWMISDWNGGMQELWSHWQALHSAETSG